MGKNRVNYVFVSPQLKSGKPCHTRAVAVFWNSG